MIFDDETNDFVKSITGGSRAWVGAHRVGPQVDPKPRNDQWTWIDGSPLDYSNWSPGQPDNYGVVGDEFCLEVNFGSSGKWNDAPCDYAGIDYYLCQL